VAPAAAVARVNVELPRARIAHLLLEPDFRDSFAQGPQRAVRFIMDGEDVASELVIRHERVPRDT
jgi:hypothetical protein